MGRWRVGWLSLGLAAWLTQAGLSGRRGQDRPACLHVQKRLAGIDSRQAPSAACCAGPSALLPASLLLPRPRRQLWLYVGVYDFAGLQPQVALPAPGSSGNGRGAPPSGSASAGPSGRWPPEWRAALGRVAAATPLLIVGWEQLRADEMLENLASEFATRLAKLGPLGEAPALMAALQGALGGALGPQLPGPMVRRRGGVWSVGDAVEAG